MVFLLSFVIFFLLIFIFWQISGLISLIFGVPFIKTPVEQIKKAFKMVGLKPNEIVYDLGSGDGRVLIVAAKDFKAKAFGFEVSPWAFLVSLVKLKNKKLKVKIYFKNYFKADFKKADVIYLYLMPKVIGNLREKFKNLKPDTKIVSYQFPIEDLKLFNKEGKIYVYKI